MPIQQPRNLRSIQLQTTTIRIFGLKGKAYISKQRRHSLRKIALTNVLIR
ncbi:hypothetical protein BDI4_700071 [Burkholderia diffusa]|nr:hypothetical protein BDI4_700071 [Burkholderia diffusa]